jgi:hypothetical protein
MHVIANNTKQTSKKPTQNTSDNRDTQTQANNTETNEQANKQTHVNASAIQSHSKHTEAQ